MLTITDQAIHEFKSILTETGARGISIIMKEGSCCQGPGVSMALTKDPDPSFDVHDYEGLKVFIQPGAGEHLSEAVLDFFAHAENPGFSMRFPKGAKSGDCGCH